MATHFTFIMNCLVTGTTGFVGKYLSAELRQKGYHVNEVNRSAVPGGYNFKEAEEGKLNAAIWIHLAGKSQDVQKAQLTNEYIEANVTLTLKLYAAFIHDQTATTFIYFSSVKAAAARVTGVLTENDRLPVDVPYGSSKRMAEDELQAVTLPAGKRLIILRPAMVYGYNPESNLFSLYKFVKKGLPYPFAAFDNKRTMVSVDNLAFVVLHIINHPEFRSGIYNLADDDGFSTNDLTRFVGQAIGKKPNLLHLSPGLIRLMFKVGDVLHLPVNTKKLNKITDNYLVSNAKLKAELGTSLPVKAEAGLKALFEEYHRKQS